MQSWPFRKRKASGNGTSNQTQPTPQNTYSQSASLAKHQTSSLNRRWGAISVESSSGRRMAGLRQRPDVGQLQCDGLPGPEDDRRLARGGAHAPGSQGDHGSRRGRGLQQVHTHPARTARHHPLGRNPSHTRRDHVPAAVVPVPLVEGGVLVPYRHRPVGGPQRHAGGRETAWRPHRRTVQRTTEKVALPPRGPHHSIVMHSFFSAMNTALLMVQPYIPSSFRQRAIDKAVAWLEERIRPGEGLYSASFNSINALLLFAALGYPADHPTRVILRDFIESLVLVREKEAYLQVVRSPMWDTTIVAHALLETQEPHAKKAAMRGLEWLRPKQILDVRGDWTYTRPHLLPGGWPFQFGNSVYPDIDDTVVTVMAMHRADPEAFAEAIKRGRDWAIGMQSHNGGWGTYDADNDHHWLNQIPFADHGFLIDDQTADVTGRCLSLLGQLGELPATSEAARRGMEFVLRKQEPDGKWWCQWGLNYTHGAWSALSGLNAIGMSHDDPRVKLAVEFLVSVQNEDGGWGEDGITYERGCYVTAPSAPTQTAWALLALMAGGAVRHPAVARGVEWLLRTQCDHGLWEEESYQGACAPSLPFLRYHGYCKYFPLWALARYRNLKRDGVTRVSLGL
ncbi:unnamed protein product [Bemisia tabaci]|uniref:Terpene cyclase/mutase family member n=1 Tax=Bemisia tabaci TaxID=7038 RepID=A0A9P0CDF9_BEMTA|nr:unnamed protein product [Bemisia tabaci]